MSDDQRVGKTPIVSLLIFAAASFVGAQTEPNLHVQPSPTPVETQPLAAGYSESMPDRNSDRNSSLQAIPDRGRRSKHGKAGAAAAIADTGDGGILLKVETNLVTIPVSVFDRNGLYVADLQRSDFKIFEDGKAQEVSYFGVADKPFTVVLLLDTSPSTEYKIAEIRSAAVAFVDQLKPDDKVMVVEFDGNVHMLAKPTGDRSEIYKAINKADFGYGTSLYDAVDFSIRKKLRKIEGRKAIVLFTDGVDTTSKKAGYDTTLAMAEEDNVVIFPIYFNTFEDETRAAKAQPQSKQDLNSIGLRLEDYALGKKYLFSLADRTGGRVFEPEAGKGGLTAAFEGIAKELRLQYNIGYTPDVSGVPGQRKRIKVRIDRPNLVIRSRDSYVVGSTLTPNEPAN